MGWGSAPAAPGAVTPAVIQHRLWAEQAWGVGGYPFPPRRLERGGMSYKRKTMCQLIFIIQGSSFTTILLLVGTRGGARVSWWAAQWLSRSGAGGGRGLQAAGGQAGRTAGSGEKLSQPGLSTEQGF